MKLASFFVASLALHGVILTLPISFFEQKSEQVVPVRLLLEKGDEVKPKPQARVAKRDPGKKLARRPRQPPMPQPQPERKDERQETIEAVAAKENFFAQPIQQTAPMKALTEKPVEPISVAERTSSEPPASPQGATETIAVAPARKPLEQQHQAGDHSMDAEATDVADAPFLQARYAYNPKPNYPDQAKREGWEGMVLLRVLINSHGEPATIEVNRSSGFDVLDLAALKTVRGWRFHPAHYGHKRVESWVKVPIVFRLADARD